MLDRALELKDTIVWALSTLTKREKYILTIRFGLDNGKIGRSYRDCGDILGICAERVRQLEAKALRKLRHPIRSSEMAWFLGGKTKEGLCLTDK